MAEVFIFVISSILRGSRLINKDCPDVSFNYASHVFHVAVTYFDTALVENSVIFVVFGKLFWTRRRKCFQTRQCIHIAAHKICKAAHFTVILNIATSAWFIDFCHKPIGPIGLSLEKLFKKFCGRSEDLIKKYQRSGKEW